ncbi:AraC family transcriptional regulator ligand-binding domain-containing protein [Leucobacter albus]|uniref:AraC family transcriptional regulator ligand-binding domain-containing protein n=1 Tax=Leucobacter albus TaxID=272210 RepID=A0ABW3TNE1_9MICO
MRVTIDPLFTRLTLRIAERAGIDATGALADAGIGAAALRGPSPRVAPAQASQFLSSLEAAYPLIGLLIGFRQRITHWGPLGVAMMSAPTVEAAAAVGLRFQELAGADTELTSVRSPESLRIEVRQPSHRQPLGTFVVTELLASAVGALRIITERNPDVSVRLPFSMREHSERLRSAFGPGFELVDGPAEIVIPRSTLRLTLPGADEHCHHQMLELLNTELAACPAATGWVNELVKWIDDRLSASPTIIAAASAFHISERTLRRRLAEYGTSYHRLLDDARRHRVAELGTAGVFTFDQISERCGYSDARSLRRALARWSHGSLSREH